MNVQQSNVNDSFELQVFLISLIEIIHSLAETTKSKSIFIATILIVIFVSFCNYSLPFYLFVFFFFLFIFCCFHKTVNHLQLPFDSTTSDVDLEEFHSGTWDISARCRCALQHSGDRRPSHRTSRSTTLGRRPR